MSETLCENECTRPDGTPHLATHGRYCTRCWARIDTPLSQAGLMMLHLRGNMLTVKGQGTDRIDGTKDAPLPFNGAAFDDASELYSMLVYWCTVWAKNLQLTAPEVARGAWRRETGTIVGLPADTSPEAAADATGRLAQWLRVRLDTILETIDYADDVEAFAEQIKDVWRMDARWSRVDRPAYSRMPCPRQDCGQKIAVYPPTLPGESRRIVCHAGHWYPEEEYEHLILVFEQHLKERAQTERVAKHLAQKYGIGA